MGALGSEMARQQEILLEASRAWVERLIEWVGKVLPDGAPPGQAVALAGALVGTLQLARPMERQGPGRELMEQGKAALIPQ